MKPHSTTLPRTSSYQDSSAANPQGKSTTSSSFPKPDNNKLPLKPSKWQPLTKVEQNINNDTNNDPFSLGDTDDEKEAKDRSVRIESKTAVAGVSVKAPVMTQNNKLRETQMESSDSASIK